MDLNARMYEPSAASEICNILQGAKNLIDAGILRHRISVMIGGDPTILHYGTTVNTPEFYLCRSGDVGFIFFLGAMDRFIISQVILGYINPRQTRDPNGFHPLAYATAANTKAEWQRQFTVSPRRLFVAGYSWGGAIAPALGWLFAHTNANCQVSVISFGAPKPTDDRATQTYDNFECVRWMNVGDAVPLVPPVPNTAPMVHLLVDRSSSANMQQYLQAGSGLVLQADRTITTSMVPPISTVYADLSLANFLVNNTAPVAIEHSIDLYASRLEAWVAANPINPNFLRQQQAIRTEPEVEFLPGEPNPEWGLNEAPRGPVIRQQGNQFLQPLPFAEVLPQLPPFVPSPAATPPYYYEKVNGTHTLSNDGNVLDVFTTKRGAKSAVKSWNQSWAKWNRSIIGDASLLATSVAENFLE